MRIGLSAATAVVAILISAALPAYAGGKKATVAVVCPPNLDYCYEKPLLKEKRVGDELAEIEARIRYYDASLNNPTWLNNELSARGYFQPRYNR